MAFVISPDVARKLQAKSPPVTQQEIEQCFENRHASLLIDKRLRNRTTPPTLWFIAKTNHRRDLKVVYIQMGADIVIKTAYEPNPDECRIYTKYSVPRS